MSEKNEFKIINEQKIFSKKEYLWRYMDLFKFIDFIRSHNLPFSRMDQFEDPLEGIPLKAIIGFAEDGDKEKLKGKSISDIILNDSFIEELSPKLKEHFKLIKKIQLRTFVSCWFQSDSESMAMWNLYSNQDGLVVRYKPKSLVENVWNAYDIARRSDPNIMSGYCGRVHYQNFSSIKPDLDNQPYKIPRVALRKEKSYEHEHEVRIVINLRKPVIETNRLMLKLGKINLDDFQIITHPKMGEWKIENLTWFLNSQSLDKYLKRSRIKLRQR